MGVGEVCRGWRRSLIIVCHRSRLEMSHGLEKGGGGDGIHPQWCTLRGVSNIVGRVEADMTNGTRRIRTEIISRLRIQFALPTLVAKGVTALNA